MGYIILEVTLSNHRPLYLTLLKSTIESDVTSDRSDFYTFLNQKG